MQDLENSVICKPLIRIMSASMEHTSAHEGSSGAGADVEAGADSEADIDPDLGLDVDTDARVVEAASL